MVNARLVTQATNATAKVMSKADKASLAQMHLVENDPGTWDRYRAKYIGKLFCTPLRDELAAYYDTHLADEDVEEDKEAEESNETGD